MTLEEKARDLGRFIGQSAEYQALRRANDALGADREALDMLRKMEQLRVNAHKMLERGERPTEDMERQLDTLLSQVQVNPTYQRLVVAQENFDKVMSHVNEWILQGIEKGAASPIITLG
ncbi:MAG: YlbF family regulator [Gemmatimonadaceae bacterium]